MILYNDFTIFKHIGYIDIFDIYDLFNDTCMYSLFPFASVTFSINIEHILNSDNNKITLFIDDKIHVRIINNNYLTYLLESFNTFIENQIIT
jgi:hypothetical protein